MYCEKPASEPRSANAKYTKRTSPKKNNITFTIMDTAIAEEYGNINSSVEYFLKFKIPKEARILDIGCSYGSLLYKLHEFGYTNLQGIDVNKKLIEMGKKEYPVIKDRIEYYPGDIIPFEDNSFDVVLMFDVIEHIPDIHIFLANQVYRIIKKEGKFIFQTPNKFINIPWEIIHNYSLTAYKKYHCSLQSLSSLRMILENAKFKKIILEKHNIITDHNKKKLKKNIGSLGLPLLHIIQRMPLSISSNFWGNCKK